MIDPECIDEIKRLKAAYALNPDSPLLAIKYSQKLLELMRQIYHRERGTREELAAYRTLLHPLTEVYQRHFNIEFIAVDYLCGVGYVSEYQGENIAREMMEIVRRFPNNQYAKTFCEAGLFFLVQSHIKRKDVLRAERDIRYFEIFYLQNSTNENIAADYATALGGVAMLQDFFKGRKTAAKLKKLARQHPYNKNVISTHKDVQRIFSAGNFFALLDNKNKYAAPPKKRRTRPRYDQSAENPIFRKISEIFGEHSADFDGMPDYGDDGYDNDDGYGNNYSDDEYSNRYTDDSYFDYSNDSDDDRNYGDSDYDNDTYSNEDSDDSDYGDDD